MAKTLLLGILFTIIGCSSDTEVQENISLNDVPVVIPEKLDEFPSIDGQYFDFLAATTVVLDDGSILLTDRNLDLVLRISEEGELLDTIITSGNGPWEVEFITFISQTSTGKTLFLDTPRRKLLVLSESGEPEQEVIIEPWESKSPGEVYELSESEFLFVYPSFEYLTDEESEPELDLVIYNNESGTFGRSVSIQDQVMIDQYRSSTAMGTVVLPYGGRQLRAYNKSSGHLFHYWSTGNQIVELSGDLDTLRQIDFTLEAEQLTDLEVDSLRTSLSRNTWIEVEPLLPTHKPLAQRMLMGPNDTIWLNLSKQSEYQEWLVLSSNGEKLRLVQLPDNSKLTHITEDHLGVVLDHTTFALYAPVIF